MFPTTTLTMIDGVRIVVPDSLDLITPYVLREQQDWFEEEIKFLRRFLQPGHNVIDIGANYGVYTLSMAQAVGSNGHVWAFEPASSTAHLLAESISANGFNHVRLVQSALSSVKGTAQLSLSLQSELNALAHDGMQGPSETVALSTLDDCLDTYSWCDIEFVKIDAEGEEANILQGGKRFFSEFSPLVQYEIKASEDLHLNLVTDFAALGYDSYRLVPGLGLLVPFDAAAPVDRYLLNLFCCKPDRASQLASHGILVDSPADSPAKRKGGRRDALNKARSCGAYAWRRSLAKFPYGVELTKLWQKTVTTGQHEAVEEALSLYALSRDATASAAIRFYALEACFNRFETLCKTRPSHLRLASLARVAREYGARLTAVIALSQLYKLIHQRRHVDTSEPFLAPNKRFETVQPGNEIQNWISAAVLEELERSDSFSSFYTGAAARQRLETIRDLGFGSPEMLSRLSLLHQRFGTAAR